MKAIVLACFLLTVLSGALTAPTPTPEASGDSPYTDTTSSATEFEPPTQEGHSDLSASGYNCSAPSEGSEFTLAAGYLKRGLSQLRKYSSRLEKTYTSNSDLVYERECELGSIQQLYFLDGANYNIWASVAILGGYAELCEQALNSTTNPLSEELQEYMQGARDVIAAVLKDYKTVLAPEHCECNPTATCSNGVVLDPEIQLTPECKHYPYIVNNLKSEVYKASTFFRAQGWSTTSVSSSQWVADRLSTASPAYNYFQM